MTRPRLLIAQTEPTYAIGPPATVLRLGIYENEIDMMNDLSIGTFNRKVHGLPSSSSISDVWEALMSMNASHYALVLVTRRLNYNPSEKTHNLYLNLDRYPKPRIDSHVLVVDTGFISEANRYIMENHKPLGTRGGIQLYEFSDDEMTINTLMGVKFDFSCYPAAGVEPLPQSLIDIISVPNLGTRVVESYWGGNANSPVV